MIYFLVLILTILLIFYIAKTISLQRRVHKLEKDFYFSQKTESQSSKDEEKREIISPVTGFKIGSRSREEWEALIGGKILNLIGALALIIGAGFFLQYAFENDWITESIRVLFGFTAGIILLFAGGYFYKKDFQIFSQGLVGAGIAILYLSVYSSFNFYHLIPAAAAFILMGAVTVISFYQAIKYNSQAVSLLGLAGGFLTPFLLGGGWINQASLFSYLALLAGGLLFVSYKKREWYFIEPLTLLAVYIIFFTWFDQQYERNDFIYSLLFLILFWGLFFAVNYIRAFTSRVYVLLTKLSIVFNALFLFAGIYFLLDTAFPAYKGAAAAFIGMIYFTSFFQLKKLNTDDEGFSTILFLLSAAAFAGSAEIQFNQFIVIIALSIIAFIFLYLSLLMKAGNSWKYLLLIFPFIFLRIFLTDNIFSYHSSEFSLLFNLRGAALITAACSIILSMQLLKKFGKETVFLNGVMHYSWSLLLFLFISVEIIDYFDKKIFLLPRENREIYGEQFNLFDNLQQLWLSGAWLVYSIILMITGLIKKIRPLRVISFVLFGVTILKIFIYDLSFLDTLYRIFSFIGLGLILLAVSYLYQKYKNVIFEKKL